MRNIAFTALTLCGLLAAGAAFAASPTPSAAPAPGTKQAEWRQRFFDKIDTNHDGVISRAEYQALVDSRFAKRHAEDLVERISGAKHVQNNLRVSEGGTTRSDTAATSPTARRSSTLS